MIKVLIETRSCACACGQTFECKITSKQRFINGHNARVQKLTKEQCEKISKAKKGKASKLKGKSYNETYGIVKAKWMREIRSGKNNGVCNMSKEKIAIMSQNSSKIRIKKFASGEMVIWNKNHTKETDERVAKYVENNIRTRSEWSEEKTNSIKKKQRLARIKQIEQNYGIAKPSYNIEASNFFKTFDEQNNTKGRYAVYGGGEYYISELGYFPDYINFEKKLIMEYDESKHYNRDGTLKQKDIVRQRQIQDHFPDFKFERIKQVGA